MRIPKLLIKYCCGFDTFIRHKCTAELARQQYPRKILDVGGEKYLNHFLKMPVITINIKGADIRYSGVRLPIKNGSFDTVVSCDTLEHIPKVDRKLFVNELVRVCSKGVIICAPLGTPEHIEAEKAILLDPTIDKQERHYLEEHIRQGLPTPLEIQELCREYNGRLLFQGDFRSVGGPPGTAVGRYAHFFLTVIKNSITDFFWRGPAFFRDGFVPCTNRFFLVICK
jgi:hypothetical protein